MANRYYDRNRYRDPYFDPYYDREDQNLDYRYNRPYSGRLFGNRENRFSDRNYDYGGYGYDYNRYNRGFETGRNRYYYDSDYDSNSYYGSPVDQGDWYDTDFTPTYTYTEYWFVPGPYEGVGPSGYRRSDERIQDDIHDRLTRHGRIDARDIHVDVHDGEVTLKGTVKSRQEKRAAEDVVDSVSGVLDVNNQLKVQHQEQTGQGISQRTFHQHSIPGGQVREGMEVHGKNGKKIGTVKEIRDNTFLVDRDMARDVYVPFQQAHASNGNVVLEVAADQVDDQHWDKPDLI